MSQGLLAQAESRWIPLRDQSVHMICTSPPYWNLRDYNIGAEAGELGRETSHDCLGWATGQDCGGQCYICAMRAVARELWRVLRDDGTLWIVIADSYSSDAKWGGRTGGKHARKLHGTPIGRTKRQTGLKPKNLAGIPQRLALALQSDGWVWRSDVIWAKPNCMPESVTDRPTRSHEHVLMFSKQAHYFYDTTAIAEPVHVGNNGSSFVSAYDRATKSGLGRGPRTSDTLGTNGTRNSRDVWTLASEPSHHQHYAAFPSALVARCILAGSSAYGVCSQCAAPWKRLVEATGGRDWHLDEMVPKGIPGELNGSGGYKRGQSHTPLNDCKKRRTTGWTPTCRCPDPTPVPATILDPFVGSGTTVRAAYQLGGHGIGLDLSFPYLHTLALPQLTAAREVREQQALAAYRQLDLFRCPEQIGLFGEEASDGLP